MNLGELISAYRDESRDTNNPPFVSNARATLFANEAEAEACRRSGVLRDSTSTVCYAQASAGDPVVKISPSIIDIVRVKTSLWPYPLLPALVDWMDDAIPGWESHVGAPTRYVSDYQVGSIRLYPIPSADCDISMTVTRMPANRMADTKDCPEIREETHPALVKWMLYRAYSSDDTDMFNPDQANKALREFELEFGKKKSARNEQWAKERYVFSTPPLA